MSVVRVASLVVVLGIGSACTTPAPPVEVEAPSVNSEPATDVEDPPIEPDDPTNRAVGEALELAVPLADGTSVSLESLRGSVVLLAIAATWDREWETVWTTLDALASADDVYAFAIASDPEPVSSRDPTAAVQLGWDPQGAVSARLRIAKYPTVVVLDREGRIVAIEHDPGSLEVAVTSARSQ